MRNSRQNISTRFQLSVATFQCRRCFAVAVPSTWRRITKKSYDEI